MSGVTVPEWLADLARHYGDAPALRAPNGALALSHAALEAEITAVARRLAGWGFGPGDIAMLALPDGPAAMVAALAVASAGAVLPVSEVEQPEEYARLLDAVPVRAVLMRNRPNSPLAKHASDRGLMLVTVAWPPCGQLGLSCRRPAAAPREGSPAPDDDAFLVRTAGTSLQPKIVIISHRSLHRAACRFRDWAGFGRQDRALCMMPAAHLHSFVRSSLPVLLAGGEVVWAPGFDIAAAPRWIDDVRPTWISAVPAIYRHLMASASAGWRPPPVRRIGVGSDRIEPDEVERLAALFAARVLQFYGMTETTPFVAMTEAEGPRGPSAAVGRVNPDWQVSIIGDDGDDLPSGMVGEITLSGGHTNPVLAANGSRAPRLDASGQLRTGDIGWVDQDGFLYVEGRSDDRINRGGEKIPPAAVEAALENHPAVARAVAFGLPDPVLGARVAAVVELVEGGLVDENALAAHAAARLSKSMSPERIFFAARIPVSATGKISRRMLAESLANASGPLRPEPAPAVTNELMEAVRKLFARSLNKNTLGAEEDFFIAGGDSLRALELIVEIEEAYGVSIPPAIFARTPTAAAIARVLAESPLAAGGTRLDVVQDGPAPPLLFAYGVNGRVGFARTLGLALGPNEALATFDAAQADITSVSTPDLHGMAWDCARIAMRAQPAGPFCIAGFSFGAHLALAIAQCLVTCGRKVAFLGVVDDEADVHKRLFGIATQKPETDYVQAHNRWALNRTPASFFAGHITYFAAAENAADRYSDSTAGWGEIALGGVEVIDVPGSHHSFEQTAGLGSLGPVLAKTKAAALAHASRWACAPATPDAARKFRLEARRAAREGDHEREVAACRDAVAANPDQPAWLWRQLSQSLCAIGDKRGAAAAARSAVAHDPWPLETFAELVPPMRKIRQRDFLDEALSRAKAEPESHPSVEVWRARVLRGLGHRRPAEASLRRGLEMAPRHLRLRMELASLCGREGRNAETAELLTGIVQDYPSLGFVWKRLAMLRLALGEITVAEAAARAALRIRDGDSECWMLLAEALERSGKFEAATEVRSRAISLSGPPQAAHARIRQ